MMDIKSIALAIAAIRRTQAEIAALPATDHLVPSIAKALGVIADEAEVWIAEIVEND